MPVVFCPFATDCFAAYDSIQFPWSPQALLGYQITKILELKIFERAQPSKSNMALAEFIVNPCSAGMTKTLLFEVDAEYPKLI
jgi:hypothetical protein